MSAHSESTRNEKTPASNMNSQPKTIDMAPIDLVETTHEGEIEMQAERTTPAMHAHFNLWSTLGINYSITTTPLAMGAYLAFVIGVGGSPAYIFGFIVAFVFQLTICLSLAELASAFPHSTGPAFWTSCTAPEAWARGLSYWSGGFTAAAWFFWTVATYLLSSQFLFALVSITRETFVAELWQIYLVYLTAAGAAILMNVTFFRYYSRFMSSMVVYLNVLFVCVLVTLLVRANPKKSSKVVFVDFVNQTGWPSDGFVFLLSLLPGISGINGFDVAAHVTDELPNPSRQVPQVMIGVPILCGLSTIPVIIAYMYCVVNELNLLTPIGGQPFAQLFKDSFRSTGLTTWILVMMIFSFFASSCAVTTTSSRTIWSLSVQNHLLGSKWLRRISGRRDIPQNAVYFTATLGALFGLLVLGPTTALNAMIGSAASCFFLAYSIPICCVLACRAPLKAKERYLNLGAFGPYLNAISIGWAALMIVVLCFPQYLPVTSQNMNYTVAVLAGVILVFTINWFTYARSQYQHMGDPVRVAGHSHATTM